MSGLTVAQLLDALMPLHDLSELRFCIKYEISYGTYKHWKHEGTRGDDPPRKLVEALSDATGIPAWRIYYASARSDLRYLLDGRLAEIDRVKDHPLFAGISPAFLLYVCISNAQTARSIERGRDIGEALRFYEIALQWIDRREAPYLFNYIRIHMLMPTVMHHGISEANSLYMRLKDDLATLAAQQTGIAPVGNLIIAHLLILADVEWFLATAITASNDDDLQQAERFLGQAIEANLTVQVPLLQLHIARGFVTRRNLQSARIWVSLAERSVGALYNPSFNTPEWFLDTGDILPDGRFDYTWEEREVQREKQRIFSASLSDAQHECRQSK